MTLSALDWALVAGYMVLSLAIGLWYTKSASGSLSHFFLGGRSMPWWLAGFSMVATTFAADTPLAVTELVAQGGISGNWLWWNMVIGGMLTTFFFARLWRRADILTEVEFAEVRYSGKPAAFLRGFRAIYLGLFMNCCVLAWVNVAMKDILKVFFDLSETQALLWTGAAMALTAFYSSLSGLLGVAVTDLVQFAIAMFGCIVLAIFVVTSEQIGGIAGLAAKLPAGSLDFFPHVGDAGSTVKTLSVGVGTFFAWVAIQWWSSWYPGAEPGGGGYTAQRMMSTRNEKEALYSTLLFQIAHYCLRPWPWILVGLCAIVLYPNLDEAHQKLGYVYAMRDFLPNGFRGLLLVAFLAAYMSTISTQLNWGASYLVSDFYQRFFAPAASDRQLVVVSRWTTVGLMVLGLGVSTQVQSIKGVWEFVMQCGAGLGLVLILRWYWWRINAWSEISATIAPFLAYGTCKQMKIPYPDSFFITVGFTTVTWLFVTLILTKPEPAPTLEAFYRRVRPGGFWGEFSKRIPGPTAASFKPLFAAWISSTALAYSTLFFIGKLIFGDWTWCVIYGVVSLASAIVVRASIIKIVATADEKPEPATA